MTRNIRIIPKLEVKNNNLVKGVNHEGLRILGPAKEFTNFYSKELYDEIIMIDCIASLFGTSSAFDLVNDIACNLRLPLSYGGGLKNLKQCLLALDKGADRIIINSALFNKPSLIKELVKEIGSANIIVSIYTKFLDGQFKCFADSSRNLQKQTLDEWLEFIGKYFDGEFLVNSIDQDGRCSGIDLKLIKFLSKREKQTFLYSGGVSSKKDIKNIVSLSENISGIVIASSLHYQIIKNINEELNYLNFQTIESIENNIKFAKNFNPKKELKKFSNISTR